MRKVIYVGEEPKEEKGVEFTHYLSEVDGWVEDQETYWNEVVYLGRCVHDGDMFACYKDGSIHIYKGHLNNGTF